MARRVSSMLLLILSVLVSESAAAIYQCGASWEPAGSLLGSKGNISPSNCQRECDRKSQCKFFIYKEDMSATRSRSCTLFSQASGTGARNRNVIMVCAKDWAWSDLKVPFDFTTNKGYIAPLPAGQAGEYKTVAYSTGGIAIHATMVPNTNLTLTYGRPQDPSVPPQPGMAISYAPKVEWPSSLVDTKAGTYVPIKSDIGAPFCAHTIHLYNGDILSCGGDDKYLGHPGNGNWGGAKGCRYFTMKGGPKWIEKKSLLDRHWYPTVIELPPGTSAASETCALIMGGYTGGGGSLNDPTSHVEVMCPIWNKVVSASVYSASGDQKVQRSLTVKYPISYLLPVGNTPAAPQLVLLNENGGSVVQLNLDYSQNSLSFSTLKSLPDVTEDGVTFAVPSGAAMLAIDLAKTIVPEIVVFGGENYKKPAVALKGSYRIKPLDQNPQWEREEMPSPAVMRPAVVLPNGKVALLNGARSGSAGGGDTCCYSTAAQPINQVWIYNPYAPSGKRYWVDSTIAPHIRMYHNEAFLGVDGTVQIVGSDQDIKPHNKPGFTMEAWIPPAIRLAIAKKTRPVINFAVTRARYGQAFNVYYSGTVSRCSLVKPAAVTHSLHANERVLILKNVRNAANGRVTPEMPRSRFVAAPGWWLLFCYSGDVWTTGKWIRLEY